MNDGLGRDLRLAAPAAAMWLGVVIGDLVALRESLFVAVTVLVIAVAFIVRRTDVARVVAVSLGCGAAAVIIAAVRSPQTVAGPVVDLARHNATVTAVVVVRGDPETRQARPRGTVRAPTLVMIPVETREVRSDGSAISVRVPLLVIASDAHWRSLLPSQHLVLTGRLATAERGDHVAATVFARGPPDRVSPPSSVQRVAGRLRSGLRQAAEPLPVDARGLLPGLVDGDVSRLTDRVRADFRTTGLTHLTAVSGANVAIVAAAALGLARAVGLGLRGRAGMAALSVLGFVVLARPSPSVVRAGVMGLLGLAALASGRRRVGLPVLAATVMVLLLADPGLGVEDGFVLSVLATGALLLLAPGLRDHVLDRAPRWMPRWMIDATAVALAAQLATAPYIALRFDRLSVLSVPANVLAAPAVPPATVLGVIAAVIAPVALPLAQVIAVVAGLPTGGLVLVSRVGAAMPAASIRWLPGLAGVVLLLACAGGAWALARRPALRAPVAFACVGVLSGVAAVHLVPSPWPPRGWAVVVCDVGQGDAVVMSAGRGAAVLVDAGPDPQLVNRCLRRLGVRRIPLVVLTHFHADHVEGLPGALAGRAVAEIDVGPLDEPGDETRRVRRWAADARVPIRRVFAGESRALGPLQWQVLAPSSAFIGTSSDPNNSSIVLSAQLPGFVALLTGDVEPPAQQALLDSGVPLDADFLKIPHHGSAHQVTDFLLAAHARVAVASVGEGNPYGHPATSTLSALRAAGTRVYRTDRDGGVALLVRDGHLVAVAEHGSGYSPLTAAARAPSPRRVTMTAWRRRHLHSRCSSATNCSSSSERSRRSSLARGPPTRPRT